MSYYNNKTNILWDIFVHEIIWFCSPFLCVILMLFSLSLSLTSSSLCTHCNKFNLPVLWLLKLLHKFYIMPRYGDSKQILWYPKTFMVFLSKNYISMLLFEAFLVEVLMLSYIFGICNIVMYYCYMHFSQFWLMVTYNNIIVEYMYVRT